MFADQRRRITAAGLQILARHGAGWIRLQQGDDAGQPITRVRSATRTMTAYGGDRDGYGAAGSVATRDRQRGFNVKLTTTQPR